VPNTKWPPRAYARAPQKKETTRPARTNNLQQQVSFDEFVKEFNQERLHQALEMKMPAQKEDQHLNSTGGAKSRHQRGLGPNLDGFFP
jgi:hypothetical protein